MALAERLKAPATMIDAIVVVVRACRSVPPLRGSPFFPAYPGLTPGANLSTRLPALFLVVLAFSTT